jgi:hypothetical protein
VTTSSLANSGRTAAAGRVVRHALPDRLFHWVGAVCVLTLLGTAFLPIAGLRFGWVTAHWIAGVALIAAVLFHVVRVLVRGTLGSMWVGRADIADALEIASATLARKLPARRPGKYSVAQKLIHHAFAVVVLATLVTGGLMLARIDSPWWQLEDRDYLDALTGLAGEYFGGEVRVKVSVVAAGSGQVPPSLAAERKERESDRERRLREDALAHPMVQAATDIFGARLVEIKPTDKGFV